MKRFLIVAGYGWSGSSAPIDYLREFEATFVPEIEFRLIKDPHGISDLEHALVDHWDYINAAAAISDFRWLAEKCAYTRKSVLSPMGLDFDSKLNPEFLNITDQYISSLISFNYHSSSIYSKFKKRYGAFFKDVSLDILFRRSHGTIGKEYLGEIVPFSKPSQEAFVDATKEYLERVFDPYFKEDKVVVLDQAISPIHLECLKYFENVEIIIVDRKATDIYVDLIKCKGLIGKELSKSHDPKMYVDWHNSIRCDKVSLPNVMYVNFEDMVLNYDATTKRILDFVGWDLGRHNNKLKYFNPEVSRKNVNFGICQECSQSEYDFINNHIIY